jgi:glycogen synthase kinase 3 beta
MRVIPPILIKLMMYQLFRGLAYIHNQNICHRDVKPENILLNPNTGILKLGDLGSAKKLVKGQVNVSYIGSRYCRPPELMFGSVHYTTYVDVWSAGCVFAHILLRRELFASTCNLDQLVEVIKVLGTPTQEQVEDLNPAYVSYNFPLIEPIPLRSMFSPVIPDTAIDLLSQLLVYRPMGRLHPMVACAHPYFDKLGEDGTLLPNGLSLPPLFNFTDSERELQEKLNINLLRKC